MASPDAELKVKIEAELAGFAAQMKGATQDVNNFAVSADGSLVTFGKSLNTLERQLKAFQGGLKNTLDPSRIALLNNAIDITKTKIAQTNDVISGNALNKFSAGANQAAFATTNLSRVLQDAPFGFIGIQNNLNPLLESFQQLKKETGSTGSALKALVGSLMGPAGIGLALSAVSAGLLLYQQYQQKANRETVAAIDLNKELADSIKTVSEVESEGRKNASSDLSKLQSLYNATQNVNIPLKERLRLANELIKQNPTYLNGLSAEDVLAGKAAESYKKLSNAILAKGLAQAGEANRQKLTNKFLEDTTALLTAQEELRTAESRVKSGPTALPGLAAAQQANQLSNSFTDAKSKVDQLNGSLKNTENQLKLNDQVTQSLIDKFGAGVVIDDEKIKKTGQSVKTVADIFKALNIDLKQVEASVDGTFGDAAKERVSAFKKAIDELISIGIKPSDSIIKGLQDKLLGAQTPELKNAGAKFAGVVVSSVQSGFESAGGVLPKQLTDGNAARTLIAPFQELNNYIGVELFPQLQAGFNNFFSDILEKGTFSFGSLGQAILKTFTSVLANEATKGILGLLNPAQTNLQKGGKGLFGLVASVIGAGGKAAAAPTIASVAGSTGGFLGTGAALGTAATGVAATGGLLLPILGGIAAAAGIASLFKKRRVEPQPAFSNTSGFNTSQVSSTSIDYGRVVFEISGVNLVGVLNRAGQKLQRFGP
jgi:hypothetical protein